jgi:hypothetical protein
LMRGPSCHMITPHYADSIGTRLHTDGARPEHSPVLRNNRCDVADGQPARSVVADQREFEGGGREEAMLNAADRHLSTPGRDPELQYPGERLKERVVHPSAHPDPVPVP